MSVEIQKALPKHMTAARLNRICMTLLRANPKLVDCTRESLYGAIFLAAQMGMEPGPAGFCYIIPYKNKQGVAEAQFQLGYKGCLRLLRNSGEIESVSARVVHKNDKFKCVFGITDEFQHEPNDENPGEPIKTYVIAKFKGGGYHIEMMNIKEVYSVRNRSQGYQQALKYGRKDTPWITDEEEMIKKTVIKRACKYLPLSIEIMDHISTDEAVANTPVVNNMLMEPVVDVVPMEEPELEAPPVPEPSKPVIEEESLQMEFTNEQ